MNIVHKFCSIQKKMRQKYNQDESISLHTDSEIKAAFYFPPII